MTINKITSTAIITLLFVLLTGCNHIVVSPIITADGQPLHYEGYVSGSYDNQLPQDYKNIEHQVVKPDTQIHIKFQDEPKNTILKQWINGKLVKQQKLKTDTFQVPNKKGTYIYTLASKWSIFTKSTVCIVFDVK